MTYHTSSFNSLTSIVVRNSCSMSTSESLEEVKQSAAPFEASSCQKGIKMTEWTEHNNECKIAIVQSTIHILTNKLSHLRANE